MAHFSACVASIVRVIVFDQSIEADATYTLVPAAIWTTIEQSVGIICAWFPPSRPLFQSMATAVKCTIKSSTGKRGTKNRSTSNTGGDSIGLPHLTGRRRLRPSADFGAAGFTQLEEENLVGGSVTTSVGRVDEELDEMGVVPVGIVKKESIEQHHDSREM